MALLWVLALCIAGATVAKVDSEETAAAKAAAAATSKAALRMGGVTRATGAKGAKGNKGAVKAPGRTNGGGGRVRSAKSPGGGAGRSMPQSGSGNGKHESTPSPHASGEGGGEGEVNARGAGMAHLSSAVCNSTTSSRPGLEGLPLVMPFSRGVMGKRGKLQKDDLFIHRGNFAKNRLQFVVPDPSTLPESATAIWAAYPLRRCALVGNSGSLTGQGLGGAIDGHDVVVRLNQAPTKGYAATVGRRATFRLLNSLWTGLYATVPTGAATLHADGSLDPREGARLAEARALPLERNATLVVTRAEAESYAALRDAIGKLRPDVTMLLLAPRVVTAAKWLLREYRIRLCEAGHGPFAGGNTPSSGLVAAYILMQTCDRLNLFGFGGGNRGDSPKYHYYSGVGSRDVGKEVHSWGAELELLAAMARGGHLTLCHSTDQDECVDPAAQPRVPVLAQEEPLRKETGEGGGGASAAKSNGPRQDPVTATLVGAAANGKVWLELKDEEETEEEEAEEAAVLEGAGETVVIANAAVEQESVEAVGTEGAGVAADVAEKEETQTEAEGVVQTKDTESEEGKEEGADEVDEVR